MSDTYILAIDLAKRSLQVCATAQGGAVLFNRVVSRAKLESILRDQAPCIVAMEAAASWPEPLQDICVDFFKALHRLGYQAIPRLWILAGDNEVDCQRQIFA